MAAVAFLLLWATPGADPSLKPAPSPARFHFASDRRADDLLTIAAEPPSDPRPQDWRPRMVIDGKVTDVLFPGQPPQRWRIAEGVFLLHDAYDTQRIYVWNATTSALTELGRGRVQTIAGLGTFILRRTPETLSAANASAMWEMLDFNPMTGEPRVAWTCVAGESSGLIAVGQRDGGPVLKLADQFITLRPGKPPVVRKCDLRQWRPVNSDAVRGSKMLLLGKNDPEVFGYSPQGGLQEYTTEVGLLDLDEGSIHKIGAVPGSWTMHTAIPHPYTSVAWISAKQAKELDASAARDLLKFSGLGISPTGYVHEDTQKVWPPPEAPRNDE